MTIAIISHPECVLHQAGYAHVEAPQRIEVIRDAIAHFDFCDKIIQLEAPMVTREQLLRVHLAHYIDELNALSPQTGMVAIDEDTAMNPHSLRAAYLAAGSVVCAVDLVMNGKVNAAFCNVRPPGHHAESAKAMGFCFFNNVAVGVMHALAHYPVQRVAIIDFDVHHGNGTQQIFQHHSQVMLCSSFQSPFYPGYDPANDNALMINLPLAAGTSGAEFREKAADAWFERLDQFKPQLIFFSAGFDAHVNDPLADLQFKDEDYVWLTASIRRIAEKYSQGRMISVLEGGYDLDALAGVVPAHINELVEK